MKFSMAPFLLPIALLVAAFGAWLAVRSPDIGRSDLQLPNLAGQQALTSLTPMSEPGISSTSTVAGQPAVVPGTASKARAGKTLSVLDQLRDSNGWTLMSVHWPKASEGNADSQLIVHSVMSECRVYRKRFDGKDISEVRAEFAGYNDPALIALNEDIWKECGKIYGVWDQFDGWENMLGAAAGNGQPLAMIWKGQELISDAESYDEGIAWLNSALLSGDLAAVALMTDVYRSAGIDREISYGWLLAACRLGFDCSADGAFMRSMCDSFSTTCSGYESVVDMSVRELGDGGFYIANQQAEKIHKAIAASHLGNLNIAEELRD